MSTPTTNRRFVRANLVVAAGTGLSRLTGFGRVAALAYALGLTSLTDTYNLANTMPNVVYELLLGGILTTTLVPVFVSHLDHDDEEATDAVVSVAVVVLLALTVVAVLAAPLIVHLYTLRVPAADQGAVRSEATTLARFFLPQIVFYGITSLGIALLNSRRRFAAAAFAPVLNNVIVIACPHRAPPRRERRHQPRHRARQPLDHAVARAVDHRWHRRHDRGRVDRGGPCRHPHPAEAAVATPHGERGRSALGLDRRLRDREPDRVAGRLDPRAAGRGRALRVPSRVHLLPAPPRPARGHAHHDVRARARGSRVAGRPRRLQGPALARHPPHRARDRARGDRLRGARASARVQRSSSEARCRAAKPSSPGTRSPGSPPGFSASASTCSCSAASTRARTLAGRSTSTSSRT